MGKAEGMTRKSGYYWLADSSYLDTEDGHWNVGYFNGRSWQVIGSDDPFDEAELQFEIAGRIERESKPQTPARGLLRNLGDRLPDAQQLFRPDRVIMPDHMLTPRMKQATTVAEMAEAWAADREELQPAAEKVVDELVKFVHAAPMEGDNAVLEYNRDAMVARAIALLEPVRGHKQLRVRFENETDYALDVHTEEKDGFLVLRLRRPAGS